MQCAAWAWFVLRVVVVVGTRLPNKWLA